MQHSIILLNINFDLCSQPEEAEEQISRTAKLGQLLAVLRIIFSLSRWQLTLTSYTPFVQLFYTHLKNEKGFPVYELCYVDLTIIKLIQSLMMKLEFDLKAVIRNENT